MRTSNVDGSRIRSEKLQSEQASIFGPKDEELKIAQRPYEDILDDGWPQNFSDKNPKESPNKSKHSYKSSNHGLDQMQESMNDHMPIYSENRNSLAATQAKHQKPPFHQSSKGGPDNLGYQVHAETNILDNSPRFNPI